MLAPQREREAPTISTKERGITVTIKYGKSYEDTWAVFNGPLEGVREDLIAYFGVDRVSVENQTLSELVVNVTSLAHGKGNAAALLGGVAIGTDTTSIPTPAPRSDEAQQPSGTQEEPQGEDLAKALLAKVEAATDVAALKRLWAENQAVFAAAPDLMAAWKAKGKALSSK